MKMNYPISPAVAPLAPVKTNTFLNESQLGLGIRSMPLIILFVGWAMIFILSLALGSVNIPLNEIIRILLGGEASRESWMNIVLKFRLPKALTATLAGAALGVGGLMMQTFFRNPLADPFALGVSSGASLGVALAVLSVGTVGGTLLAGFSLMGDLGLALAASLGAVIVLVIVLSMAQRVQDNLALLILGLMFGYLTSAMVSLLLYFSVAERIQAYINWTFGSFGGVSWGQMPLLAGGVGIGLLLALLMPKSLNALLLGEAYAHSLGADVKLTRIGIIVSTALLAGSVTAFCGPIGFLGTAVPHLCRIGLRTSDHRTLVPASILVGAICALIAALIAEVPGSNIVLPLNAVTALFGAPVVIFIVLRQRRLRETFGI